VHDHHTDPFLNTDWGGMPFLAFCLNLAHSASVPISVHLDHATTEEDIDTSLTFAERGVAFDSIMVDASHADTDEENLEVVSRSLTLVRID
jgi:fructose-bisphosphate aldolase class II